MRRNIAWVSGAILLLIGAAFVIVLTNFPFNSLGVLLLLGAAALLGILALITCLRGLRRAGEEQAVRPDEQEPVAQVAVEASAPELNTPAPETPASTDDHHDLSAAMIQALDGYIVIKDLDKRIVLANAAYAHVLGAERPEQLIGMTSVEISQAFPSGNELPCQAADELAAQVLQQGEVIERDERTYAGAQSKLLKLRINPLFGMDGRVWATMSCWRDITGERKLEHLLHHGEGIMDQAERTGRFGWFSLNSKTGDVYWSPGMFAVHGLPPAEFPPTAEEVIGMVHPDDVEKVRTHLGEALHGRVPLPLIFRSRTPAGVRHLHHSFYYGREPGTDQQLVIGIVYDVTQFAKAEQQLAELNEQLNQTNIELEQSNRVLNERNYELADASKLTEAVAQRFDLAMRCARIGVWDWELDSGNVRVNDILLETLGYDPTNLPVFPRRQWERLVHPEDLPLITRWPARPLSGKTALHSAEIRLRQADGGWRWFACRGQVVWHGTGQVPQRMLGTLMDIHHEHQAEIKLRQAQRLAAIGTLAGGIAHDFNNILFAIIGNAEMAELRLATESPAQQNLCEILNASGRAKKLVSQLLAFAKPEQASSELVDPAAVVDDVVEFIRPLLPTSITLATRIETGKARVNCNALDLHEVIMNMCLNASQALESANGLINLILAEVDLTRSDLPELPELAPGKYICLQISDTGVGIDPAKLPHIFEPYFTTREIGHGRGLGLAVAHGIVSAAGGGITVASVQGQGSIFNVYLPMIEAKKLIPEVIEQGLEINGGTERILLACSDQRVALLVETMLGRLGYQVAVAESCKQALALLSNQHAPFDLLITVQALPDMTGAELMQRVRELNPEMDMLLLSHFNPVPGTQVLPAHGVFTHLAGPQDLPSLARSVRDILDGK